MQSPISQANSRKALISTDTMKPACIDSQVNSVSVLTHVIDHVDFPTIWKAKTTHTAFLALMNIPKFSDKHA